MSDKVNSKYDVIIIGAGIGGLVCGGYLAKVGLKVLIVEKNDKPGGCCVSFKRNGVRFDAGVHTIGSCSENGVLYRILKKLDIKHTFIRLNPTDRFFFADDKIEVPKDIRQYTILLQKRFPKEKTQISKFFDELINLAKNIQFAHKKYRNLTYQDLLDKIFQNTKLISLLSAQAGYLGLIPNEVSAVSMCAMLSSYLKDGAHYPLGGASSFSNNLATNFESFGGRTIFQSQVKKLLIKNDNVTGVLVKQLYKNNAFYDIYSDMVVSNVDAAQTVFELMDSSLISTVVKENIKQSKESSSLFILYLSVKIDKKVIAEKIGWHYPEYDVNRNLKNYIYITSPSLYDSTASANGVSVIETFEIFPYSYNDVRDWKECKSELEKKIIAKLSEIIPEIKDSIRIKESATPRTIRNYTFNKNGAPFGWALTPGQFDRNEVMTNTLSRNLYLTGHWTNPGGGIVPVAISGYNTARKIISDLKRKIPIHNFHYNTVNM